MQIILKVRDDGTAVIEKFGKTAEKEGDKASVSWGKYGAAAAAAGVAAAAAAAVVIKSAIDTADQAVKTADKLGMTVEAYTALRYHADLAGVANEGLATSLQMMSRNIADVVSGGGQAKDAIAALGLNAAQLAQMKPDQAVAEIAQAMEKIPEGSRKVQIAMDIFGRSGADMINVMRGGKEALAAGTAEAANFGQVISAKTARQAELFNDNLSRMKALVTGSAMEMAGSLLPTLNELTGKFLAAYQAGGLLHAVLGAIGSASIQQRIAVITGEIDLLKKEMLAAAEGWETLTREDENFGGEVEERLQAKIDALEKERKLLEAEARKIAEASAIKPPGSPAASGGAGAGAKEIEDLTKRVAEIHAQAISEQQKLAEDYVRNWIDLERARAAGVIKSDEDLALRRLEISEQYQQQATQQRDSLLAQNLADMAANIEAMQESFMTEAELEQIRYDEQLLALENYKLSVLYVEETYNALKENTEKAHQDRVTAIKNEALKQQYGNEHAWMERVAALLQGSWSEQLQGTAALFGQMSTLMLSQKKKEFELGKKAAIAQALVSTFLGAAKALGTYGFPLGAVFAALTIAAGMMNINKIRSQQFMSGGGGGGATPTFNANPGTGLPEPITASSPTSALPSPPTSAAAATGQRNVNVVIKSTSRMVDMEWVRDGLIPVLNEAVGDGIHLGVTQ